MILKENLDELQQTVLLMQTEDGNEYFDSAVRNRKFGRVDPLNGPRILEKNVLSVSWTKISLGMVNDPWNPC